MLLWLPDCLLAQKEWGSIRTRSVTMINCISQTHGKSCQLFRSPLMVWKEASVSAPSIQILFDKIPHCYTGCPLSGEAWSSPRIITNPQTTKISSHRVTSNFKDWTVWHWIADLHWLPKLHHPQHCCQISGNFPSRSCDPSSSLVTAHRVCHPAVSDLWLHPVNVDLGCLYERMKRWQHNSFCGQSYSQGRITKLCTGPGVLQEL